MTCLCLVCPIYMWKLCYCTSYMTYISFWGWIVDCILFYFAVCICRGELRYILFAEMAALRMKRKSNKGRVRLCSARARYKFIKTSQSLASQGKTEMNTSIQFHQDGELLHAWYCQAFSSSCHSHVKLKSEGHDEAIYSQDKSRFL